jgi:hypothetical protein
MALHSRGESHYLAFSLSPFRLGALARLSLAGQEHGRTIPLADVVPDALRSRAERVESSKPRQQRDCFAQFICCTGGGVQDSVDTP